jgi:hypothetical protein
MSSWLEQGQHYFFCTTEGYLVVSSESIIEITVKMHMIEHHHSPTNIRPNTVNLSGYYINAFTVTD